MANVEIKIKRSEVGGSSPSTSDLAVGELAMNPTDGKLYTKTSGDSIVVIGEKNSTSSDVTDGLRINSSDIFTNFVKDMEDHGRTSLHTEAGFVDELESSNDMIDEANSTGYSYESGADYYTNATGSSNLDSSKTYDTESNYIQQEWTNSNQSTSQATVSGTSVTLSSGTWPTNCENGRISFDSGSTFEDITSRDSGTEITLDSAGTNGTYDYIIRLSDFNSGSVELNSFSKTVILGYSSDVTSTSFTLDSSGTAHGGTNAGAVDNSTTTWWMDNTSTPWWSIDFGSGNTKRIEKYTICGQHLYGNPSGNDTMNSWRLEGSNDNSNWTTVDTRTGVTTWADQPATVDFTNMTGTVGDYRYYRINVTANNGGPNCGLAELSMFEATTSTSTVNPTTEYISVTDTYSNITDISNWGDINSTSITETTNNQSLYYWVSIDPASNYGSNTEIKIFHQGESLWRTIAKNNAGTWEYNSSVLVAGGYTSDVTSGETFTTDNPINSGVVGNAFDDSNSTNVDFMTSSTSLLPRHIAVEYASAKTVTKVTINCNGSEGRGKNVTFKVQGSNDNSSWTDLHTESGYNFATGNSSSDSFTFSNSTSYLHYRIRWENSAHTAANPSQNGGFPTMYEIEMMESTPGVTADAYSGTTATANDMLHAVSEAISENSHNRMTKAEIEAITDAEWNDSNGFSLSSEKINRGVTFYSSSDTENPSLDTFTLNYDSGDADIDLRTKQWTGTNDTPDAPASSPRYIYLFVVDEHTSGTPQYAVTRNGTNYTNVTFDATWTFNGTKVARRAVVDMLGMSTGTDPRMKVTNSAGDDYKLHAVGLQTRS